MAMKNHFFGLGKILAKSKPKRKNKFLVIVRNTITEIVFFMIRPNSGTNVTHDTTKIRYRYGKIMQSLPTLFIAYNEKIPTTVLSRFYRSPSLTFGKLFENVQK